MYGLRAGSKGCTSLWLGGTGTARPRVTSVYTYFFFINYTFFETVIWLIITLRPKLLLAFIVRLKLWVLLLNLALLTQNFRDQIFPLLILIYKRENFI